MVPQETKDICAFDKLFRIHVPHILEMIFFSLDFESFLKCLTVNKEWNRMLTSEPFKMKARSVFKREVCFRLSCAVRDGNLEQVRRLIAMGMVDTTIMNCHIGAVEVNGCGQLRGWLTTPLQESILRGYTDLVQLLLDNGADPNLAFTNGITPLMNAVDRRGCNDIVRALLDKGADPNQEDVGGMTALHRAVKMRSNKVKVKLLLKAGANPYLDSYRGMSPVHFALALGNHDLVNVIQMHQIQFSSVQILKE